LKGWKVEQARRQCHGIFLVVRFARFLAVFARLVVQTRKEVAGIGIPIKFKKKFSKDAFEKGLFG